MSLVIKYCSNSRYLFMCCPNPLGIGYKKFFSLYFLCVCWWCFCLCVNDVTVFFFSNLITPISRFVLQCSDFKERTILKFLHSRRALAPTNFMTTAGFGVECRRRLLNWRSRSYYTQHVQAYLFPVFLSNSLSFFKLPPLYAKKRTNHKLHVWCSRLWVRSPLSS